MLADFFNNIGFESGLSLSMITTGTFEAGTHPKPPPTPFRPSGDL
jgi:hypothetical protein